MQKVNSVNRVLEKHPGRLPDGKACPLRVQGSQVGRTRKRTVFPRPCVTVPVDRQVQAQRQASARPGGGEAPASGGAGALAGDSIPPESNR